ncbi:hypothetical protein PS918_05765 [Pseudomonas fluorescens]|uniref:RHS repeat-associated core domain-containing protein n=1 Tax=Pseudomonas fluorescens TaxID=294 RepID=A0A5E7UUP5_PSEFL|nr:RHS repeat-associated core domain-containing protein [Pseudomonas fluorescens]VVQ14733.1 hypothetical protein PS918_05765 [Pseudomonas fluorescens]
MPARSRKTLLLAPDYAGSVSNTVDSTRNNAIAYTPYGDSPTGEDPQNQFRFNGVFREAMTGWYSLGNGYRMYSPVLMRFLNQDSFSPFGKGGLNAYAYCGGDSINRRDPNGRAWLAQFITQANRHLTRVGVDPLSETTVHALTNRVHVLGGEGVVEKLAKRANVKTHYYLLNDLPELNPIELNTSSMQHLTETIETLKARELVQLDIAATLINSNPDRALRYTRMARRTQSSIEQLEAPMHSIRSEPPPNYFTAITTPRNHNRLPSYREAIVYSEGSRNLSQWRVTN